MSFNVKSILAKDPSWELNRGFIAFNSNKKPGKETSTFMAYVLFILVLFLSFGNIRSIDFLPAGYIRENVDRPYLAPRVRVRN